MEVRQLLPDPGRVFEIGTRLEEAANWLMGLVEEDVPELYNLEQFLLALRQRGAEDANLWIRQKWSSGGTPVEPCPTPAAAPLCQKAVDNEKEMRGALRIRSRTAVSCLGLCLHCGESGHLVTRLARNCAPQQL
uniref:Uncharacterized protein n=1 Tax=Sphaerodactylus townsendi TaxID=933632 RepID=A0ACB8FSX0_9SAUR